jgi:hypothetical protein
MPRLNLILIAMVVITNLTLSVSCNRQYNRKAARHAKAMQKAESQKNVEAKEKTEDSFKVEKDKSLNPPTSPDAKAQATATPVPSSKAVNGGAENLQSAKSTPGANPQNATPQGEFKANSAEISIATSALDKEFLLQGALIPQAKVAMGRSIKSRVIAFQKKGKTLVMLEATQGHTVNADFPQKLILATFPILKEEDGFITFDFNAGMTKLLTLSDWYAKDFSGPDYSSEAQFASYRVSHSYIEDAQINELNQLVIRQLSLMRPKVASPVGGSVQVPMEAKYYLSPYRPSENYQPVHSPRRFDEMGFFEINPQLDASGATLNFATRFNPEKPIVFAISSNTPPEYQKAVEDGILYWNKAFGKEIVKAIKAPEGIRAPDMNHNVVQWVKWDYAGSAYADGQMDPRTGEILHAQVYLTSAFAFSGKNKAREIQRKLEQSKSPSSPLTLVPEMSGFQNRGWCDFDGSKSLVESINKVIESGLPDEAILKISQDYVREVVAHEIGHTLGLRHNFAGTLAATYTAEERPKLFQDYLSSGTVNTAVTYSSSVMDYHRLEESTMIGHLIGNATTALNYDHKAVQKLYFDQIVKQDKEPLFCTDSHALPNGYVDCLRFDFGASPLEYARWDIKNSLENLPQTLLEKYIRNKTDPQLATPWSTEQVPLEQTSKVAATLLGPQATILKLLTEDRSLIQIERAFKQVDERTEAQVKEAYTHYLAAQINQMGGLIQLLDLVPENYASIATENLQTLLAKPSYQKGTALGDRTFAFTNEELQQISRDLTAYFKKLELSLVKAELNNLKSTKFSPEDDKKVSRFSDNVLAADLALAIQKKISTYAFGTTSTPTETEVEKEKVVTPISNANNSGSSSANAHTGAAANTSESAASTSTKQYEKVAVKLPSFKYPLDVRIIAAGLLGSERGEDILWGVLEKEELKKSFKKTMEDALTLSPDALEISRQNKTVHRWILENKKVLAELN